MNPAPPPGAGVRWALIHHRPELAGLAAFCLAWLFITSLQGELPYHDVARFAAQIAGDRFVFDLAHVFMQPATLIWHRLLGDPADVVASQKSIHAVFTAAGISVFAWLVAELRVRTVPAVAATVLLAASCSVMTLAPSGHMKLLVFPFINLALAQLVLWERDLQAGRRAAWRLPFAGLCLGIASAFLVSALAAAPFACLAVAAISARGAGLRAGLWEGVVFGGVCGLVFAAAVAVCFVGITDQSLSLAGLAASLQDKVDVQPGRYDLINSLVRVVFGTSNNIVATPQLGSVGRAVLAGQISDLRPYLGVLLGQGSLMVLNLAVIGLIYLRGLRDALSGRPVVAALAFLCGAQAWTIYYGLNDPEHWFMLTAPMLLLLIMPQTGRIGTPVVVYVWAAVALSVNLVAIGLPTARYPLQRAEADLRSSLSANDLVLSFAAYPGHAYLGFFSLPDVPQIRLDQIVADRGVDGMFAMLDQAIPAALSRSGRVLVFQALDPRDWDAPWTEMLRRGLTKPRLTGFFADHFQVRALPDMAGMKVWQITRR